MADDTCGNCPHLKRDHYIYKGDPESTGCTWCGCAAFKGLETFSVSKKSAEKDEDLVTEEIEPKT